MLMEQTLQTLNALRLPGMATAFAEQQTSAASMSLPFDERFAMLVDREHTWLVSGAGTGGTAATLGRYARPNSRPARRAWRMCAMAAGANWTRR